MFYKYVFFVYIDINVFDWGQFNKIVVVLEQMIYIWDVEFKICKKKNVVLEEEEVSLYFVFVVCWDNEGYFVVMGDNKGYLKVKVFIIIYKKKEKIIYYVY